MSKRNADNLRIKRKYLIWLKDARGLCDASIDKAAASIDRYAVHVKGSDYRGFHSEKARGFKRHLASARNEKTHTALSPGTIHGTLRELKAFFTWLADQPGYKSKVSHADAAYFTPDRRSSRAARGGCWKPHPSPEQMRHVLAQMPAETVLQRRDRALFAFLFLTGSREGAAITMRLNHVDLAARCVHFDGRTVDTKFGKSSSTSFFPVGELAGEVLAQWIGELRTIHFWGPTDPLFPRTLVGIGRNGAFEAIGLDRAQWKSPSRLVQIFKQAFLAAGLPPSSPHRIRDTLAEMAREFCRTPEEYKSWSQSLSHDDVLTTFTSYGSVSAGRQNEVMAQLRRRGTAAIEYSEGEQGGFGQPN